MPNTRHITIWGIVYKFNSRITIYNLYYYIEWLMFTIHYSNYNVTILILYCVQIVILLTVGWTVLIAVIKIFLVIFFNTHRYHYFNFTDTIYYNSIIQKKIKRVASGCFVVSVFFSQFAVLYICKTDTTNVRVTSS